MNRLALVFVALFALVAPACAEPITLTDIAGRTVVLDEPAKRIVLVEARQVLALSLVDPDFAGKIVGWANLDQLDAPLYRAYVDAFPHLGQVPDVTQDATASAELVIAAAPDLVILSGGGISEDQAALIAVLESAGIGALYIDFRADPWNHTIPSLELLGAALGTSEQAGAFIDFYRRHRDAVIDAVQTANPRRPDVFMFMQASVDNELMAPGKANLGSFVEAVGGHNIGADVVPGMFGALNPEYLLTTDPAIVIGTGGPWFRPDQGITAGPGTDAQTLQAGLTTFMGLPTVKDLTAVKSGRAYALWHNFHNCPLNVVALEVLAKWIQPALFEDLDPQATVDEINATYLPVAFPAGSWGNAGGPAF